MDRGAWWAAVHEIAKSWTRLSNFTFTFHLHALEREMATHSSILAWRISGMGEPGELKRPSSSSSHCMPLLKTMFCTPSKNYGGCTLTILDTPLQQ